MPPPSLSRLLRPASVAFFGGRWAEAAVRSSLKMRYGGALFPVHPSRKKMGGVKCFRRVCDLPSPPDAAFVGVNRGATVAVARELAEAGCGGAVCFASGFGEAGGIKLQNELTRAAGDMPFLGPNCYGFINYLDGALLWPDAHSGRRAKSGAAFLSQSSNIAVNVAMHLRGLPLSYVVCAGNQAQTGIAEIGEALLADKRVSAIGMYLEGIARPGEFAAFAAKAEETGTRIAAIKTGRSVQSRRAAAAHTASLSGEAEASSAFLQKCGITEAQSLPQLMEILKMFHLRAAPRGRKIFAMACSGGEAGLFADSAARAGLQTPQPKPARARELAKCLGPLVRIANPLDYHTFVWGDEAESERVFSLAVSDDCDMNILTLDYPSAAHSPGRGWKIAADAFCRAAKKIKSPCAVLSTLPENMSEKESQKLLRNGVVPFAGMDDALEAIAATVRASECENAAAKGWRPHPPFCGGALFAVDEAEAKDVLSRAGIDVPRGMRAKNAAEAGKIADSLIKKCGGRIALKGLGCAHKTEKGLLALNLESGNAAARAGGRMQSAKGFLVEEMVGGAAAEMLVCARRDAVYGITLTVAAGGIAAEFLKDAATIVLPADEKEILAAMRRLHYWKILRGWRGLAPADVFAAAKAAFMLANLLETEKNIAEAEINPLLVMPKKGGAVAADALIKMRKEKKR